MERIRARMTIAEVKLARILNSLKLAVQKMDATNEYR